MKTANKKTATPKLRSNSLDPKTLHEHLDASPHVEVEFNNEDEVRSFRSLIYQVNAQGNYVYRTMAFLRKVRTRTFPVLRIIRMEPLK